MGHKKMNWKILVKAVKGTISITGMIFLIIAGATAFSQILAYSGATEGLSELTLSFSISHITIVIAMMVVILILGGFMDVVAIMMITVPIFLPIIKNIKIWVSMFSILK